MVIAEDELACAEQSAVLLSDRDRDRFLALPESPPTPTPALKQAASRHKASRG
jgi:uncharacterized protein (DUF1778 family)